jgi:hypothetical protein
MDDEHNLNREASGERKSFLDSKSHNSNGGYFRKIVESAMDLLSTVEQAEYREVIKIAPGIAESESFYKNFLHIAHLQAAIAAKCLATYWTVRKANFGERAHRPLFDLSGNGALTSTDIDFLKRGKIVQVANDSNGRTIIVNDVSRLNLVGTDVKQFSERCSFFTLAKAAFHHHKSHTSGVAFFHVVTNSNFSEFERKQFRYIISLFEFLPLILSEFHICCIPPPGQRHQFEKRILSSQITLLGNSLPKHCIQVHIQEDTESMKVAIKKHGIDAELLVPVLGGSWSYSDYEEHIESEGNGNRSSEYAELARTALENHGAVDSYSFGNESLQPVAKQSSDTNDGTTDVEEAPRSGRLARKRKMDAIYARQRRIREKSEEEVLQKQYSDIRQINMKLEQENKRLQRLVSEANGLVATLESKLSHVREDIGPASTRQSSLQPGGLQSVLVFPVHDHGWRIPLTPNQPHQGTFLSGSDGIGNHASRSRGPARYYNTQEDAVPVNQNIHPNGTSHISSQTNNAILHRMIQEVHRLRNATNLTRMPQVVASSPIENHIMNLVRMNPAIYSDLSSRNESIGNQRPPDFPRSYTENETTTWTQISATNPNLSNPSSSIRSVQSSIATILSQMDLNHAQQIDVAALIRALQNGFNGSPPS